MDQNGERLAYGKPAPFEANQRPCLILLTPTAMRH